jgi:hypothetical protein
MTTLTHHDTAFEQNLMAGCVAATHLLVNRFKTYTSDAFAQKLQALCGLLGQAADAAAAAGMLTEAGAAPAAATTGNATAAAAGATPAPGPAQGGAPAVVDLHQMMYRFTLDTFSHIGFAQDPGCLSGWDPIPFATSFDRAQTVRCCGTGCHLAPGG